MKMIYVNLIAVLGVLYQLFLRNSDSIFRKICIILILILILLEIISIFIPRSKEKKQGKKNIFLQKIAFKIYNIIMFSFAGVYATILMFGFFLDLNVIANYVLCFFLGMYFAGIIIKKSYQYLAKYGNVSE